MKKITLISAATAATFAFAPSAFAGPTQTLKVKLGSTKAGTKAKPTATSMSFSTGTPDIAADGTKATLKAVKITLPKGIALNYQAFPECTEALPLDAQNPTCDESAPKSQVGSGSATASVTDVDYQPKGELKTFIGSGGRLLIQTYFPGPPALIDGVLTGKVSTSGGAYSFDIQVPEYLQVPIAPATFQQIIDFTLNFQKKTVKKGKKVTPLIGLTSCPKGGYVFKGDFTFRDNQTTSVSTTVKCTAPKKKK